MSATDKLSRYIASDIQRNLRNLDYDISNMRPDQIDRIIDDMYITKSGNFDDSMSLLDILNQSGQSIEKSRVEFEGLSWVDEHSGTFSWRTKSQENLNLDDSLSKIIDGDITFDSGVEVASLDPVKLSTNKPAALEISKPPPGPASGQPSPGMFNEVLTLFAEKNSQKEPTPPPKTEPSQKDTTTVLQPAADSVRFNINKSAASFNKRRSQTLPDSRASVPEKPPRRKSADKKKPPAPPAPPQGRPPEKPPRRSSQERTKPSETLPIPVFEKASDDKEDEDSVPKTGFDFLDNW